MVRFSWRVKALAHLEMARPYTVCHAGLIAVAGAALASNGHGAAWRIGLAGVVTLCGWEAGLYAGDYYDRDLDAHSKPTRPVPSGRVSAREAFLTMCGLIAFGYACALVLGFENLLLAMITTALGIAYSKVFKARALLGNFDRGLLGACAALFGGAAVGKMFAPAVLILCVVVFFHDAASNLVGTVRDVEGDRTSGYATVPVVYGVDTAITLAAALALASLIGSIALLGFQRAPVLSWALFLGSFVLAAYAYLSLWLRRTHLTRPEALAAHKWLVVERLMLISAFLAATLAPGVALAMLVGATVLTISTQLLLRDRYEPQVTERQLIDSYAGG
ncbi:MAG: UbiA prenyltransferase [Chloroflexi bacterium]|nr:UbiA prenyltransferase [Chloroflexota bacterium]